MAVPYLTRRAALRGTLVAAVGVVAGYVAVRASGAAGDRRGTTAANAYGPPASTAGKPLASLDSVPAGGGVVLHGIVLTRDAGGDVHAFSATCTHQGCTVGVAGDVIACPCHGSRFDPDTGEVTRGPATRPLPPVTVAVRNGKVFRS